MSDQATTKKPRPLTSSKQYLRTLSVRELVNLLLTNTSDGSFIRDVVREWFPQHDVTNLYDLVLKDHDDVTAVEEHVPSHYVTEGSDADDERRPPSRGEVTGHNTHEECFAILRIDHVRHFPMEKPPNSTPFVADYNSPCDLCGGWIKKGSTAVRTTLVNWPRWHSIKVERI